MQLKRVVTKFVALPIAQAAPQTSGTQVGAQAQPEAPSLAQKSKKVTKKKTVKKKTVKKKTVVKKKVAPKRYVAPVPRGSACERGIARAQAVLPVPGATVRCGELPTFKGAKYRGETALGGWNWDRRSWDTSNIYVKGSLDETQAYRTALHELGHAKTYRASEADRNRAYAAVASHSTSNYYSNRDEIIAQAYTVYVGGGTWLNYRSIPRAKFNQVRSILG